MSLGTLRRKAEILLKGTAPLARCGPPPAKRNNDLARELEIQHVELELQNEELRRARSDLEESRDRFVELYEMAPIAYLTFDADGRIVDANYAAAVLLGVAPGVLTRKPLSAFMRTSDADAFHVFRDEVFASNTSRTCELTVRGKGGAWLPIRMSASAAWHGKARQTCRCVLVDLSELRRDVSERQEALRRLRESEERFRQITDHVEDVFYVVEHDRTLSYVSPAYRRIWGRPSAQLRGRVDAWPSDVQTEDAAEVEVARANAWRGDPFDIEYRIVHADGTVRWIHDRAFPIEDASGRVTRMIGVAHDATAEREIELELRQVRKMEAVGALASGIAHDFSNVLQAVVACATLAADERLSREQARQMMLRARDIALRAGKLPHRLTAFSRKELAKRKPLALDEALASAAGILRPLLGEHIRLRFEGGAPGAFVLADNFQLEQMLLNLASNARDAMTGGGRLTIRSEAVPSDGRVRFVVSDTGTGMDDATKARIFDPFFTTKEKGRGTGLGLATVFAVVRQLEGTIRVESQKGKGTSFFVELPTCAPTEPAPPDGRGVPAATALLVEDEPLIRMLVRHHLEELGLEVLEAGDASHAWRLCEGARRPPDVLIADVLMPRVTGPQLAKELRAQYPKLRVLFISGDPLGVDTVTLGADTHLLAKPFTKEDLKAELLDLLEDLAPATLRDAGRG
jgi:PAS domain S-box-containing protein